MKKMFKSLVIGLAIVGLVAGGSFANGYGDQGPNMQYADATLNVQTDAWQTEREWNQDGEEYTVNGGTAFHAGEVYAGGSVGASAKIWGYSDVDYERGAFQEEVAGGELSGSYAKTTGYSTITGFGKGYDCWYSRRNPDFAGMTLVTGGTVYQQNGAYSDDNNKNAVAFGNNGSRTTWTAFDSDYSSGGTSFDTQASKGEAIGGTLVYAKQVDDYSLAAAITGSTGSAKEWKAEELEGSVDGFGHVYGSAILPGSGVSGFTADYEFAGGLNSYGVAGGVAFTQTDKATVASFVATNSVIANNGFGGRSQEMSSLVAGAGFTSGAAQLDGMGYASYGASYSYDGFSPVANQGVAYGTATITKTSPNSVSSSASSYAGVSGQSPR